MKYLLAVLLLFPFGLFSQQLPDSALAAKAGVKKLVILRTETDQPDDTEAVYFFDKGWRSDQQLKTAENKKQSVSAGIYHKDSSGRTVYFERFHPGRTCYSDTVGIVYHYNSKGQLIHQKFYSCEKGSLNIWFVYDSLGRITTEYSDLRGDRMDSRTEYVYNSSGQLVSQTNWWASYPEQSKRDSSDYITARIEYSYDPNGLIKEARATDTWHYLYIPLFDWKSPDQEPEAMDDKAVFRYIYFY